MNHGERTDASVDRRPVERYDLWVKLDSANSAMKIYVKIAILAASAVFVTDINRQSIAEVTSISSSLISEDVQNSDNLISLNIVDNDVDKTSFSSLSVSSSSSEQSISQTSYTFSSLESSKSLTTTIKPLKSTFSDATAGSGSSLVGLDSSSSIDDDAFDSFDSNQDSADQLSSNNNQGGYYWYNRRNKKQQPSSTEDQSTLKQAFNKNSQNTFASLTSIEAHNGNSSDAPLESFVDSTSIDNELKVSSIDSDNDGLTISNSSSSKGDISLNTKSNSTLLTGGFSSQNTDNTNDSRSSSITSDQFSSSFASAF